MYQREQNPLTRAYVAYPANIFERSPLWQTALGSSLASFAIYGLYKLLVPKDTLVSRLAGASAFLIGDIADHISTCRAFDATNKAKDRGIEEIPTEPNIFLRNITTSQELNRSPKRWLLSMAGIVLSFNAPSLGFSCLALKAVVVWHHSRVTRRYDYAAELAHHSPGNQ